MSSAFRASSISLALSLIVSCQVFSQPRSSSSYASASPAENELSAVVEKYFELYAGKDLEGLMNLWSGKSPDYASFKQRLQRQFAVEDSSFSVPAISRLKMEGARASLRATVNLTAVNLKNRQKRDQRLTQNFALISEDGKWKVWRSAPAEKDLAEALAKAKTDDGRAALLADEKELVTVELARALGDQGDRIYRQGDYSQALPIYQLEQSIADRIGDKARLARALSHIGTVHAQRGDYTQALDLFQKSLALSESLEDKTAIASARGNIGRIRMSLGDYTEALESLQKSLAMFEAMEDKVGISGSLNNIGLIHISQGDYAQAMEMLQRSLTINEALGNQSMVATARGNIGNVYYEQGDYARSLESIQKSLAIYEALRDKDGIAKSLNNIGRIYRSRGDYARALEYYQKSLTISEANENKYGIAIVRHNIGNVLRHQGAYEQALESYEKALALRESIKDIPGIASTLDNIGHIYRLKGDYGQALERFQRSLAMNQTLKNKRGIAIAFNSIGRVHNAQGARAQAIEDFQKSLALSEEIGDRAQVADTLINIGDVYQAQSQSAQALDLATRAADLAGEIGYNEALWKARFASGIARRALNQPALARPAFEEAITIIEALRENIAGGAGEQQRFFESKVSPYYAMVDLLAGEGRAAEALIFAERAKSRALLDALRTGRADIAKALTAREQEREIQLNGQLVALNTQIVRETDRPKPDQNRLTELKVRLQKARLDFESFQTNLYAIHPELRTQRGEAPTLRIQEIASLLPDASSAMLEYVVTEDKSYLFAVTTSAGKTEPDIRFYTLPINRDDLDRQTEAFRHKVANRDLGFRASAARLYELLLKPAEAQLRGKTNLIIAPDDKLWDLPFQALLTGANQFMIESAAIAYTPSLTVLREIANRRKNQDANPAPATLLALGNPALGAKTIEKATLAMRDEKLDPLPEAEKEVMALGQLYGGAHSRIYIGADAREDRFKAEAAQARILHFATHGILNNASPMYSYLALAQGDTNEDGLLEAWEVMQMDLRAELVVLSACETARGRFGAGEGMIGLSWAMFIAGAPATVVSQWKVESASTRDLMIGFHRQALTAKSGTTKTEALRQAALKLMKNPATSHPFYWAGFALVGDGR